MNLDKIKIGYYPYRKDFNSPGDRRRFIFYSSKRNIKFDFADPSYFYDIIYLTYGADLSQWLKYKKNNPNVKIIFELIDSYVLESISFTSIFRGLIRFLLKKESSLWLSYKLALRSMISVADAVVCSTFAQKIEMSKYNKNIHLSLDYFTDEIKCHKSSFISSGTKLKLIWEGQSHTVQNLILLKDVFQKLKDKIELHIITDFIIEKPIKFFNKNTNNILKSLEIDYKLIEWNKNDFSCHIANCDLAIIPISCNNPMMWNKPENKLLMFWEIGIPVLTSNTPAYKHVFNAAGLDLACESSSEWINKIEAFINSSLNQKLIIVNKANDYICKYHNENEILKKWDNIFDSLKIIEEYK
jgi:hypothetical protein